ncbi:MAG: AMP-binding protein, partial [Pseudomonadota bacterium]
SLYSHRSTVLHALMGGISLQTSLSPGKRILPVVPLFHVNAWSLPYAAPLTGVSLVFPGPALDGASLFKLMESEEVFSAWGVPTVWLGLLGEIKAQGRTPKGFGEVIIGGSAAPRSMIEAFEKMDVNVVHAWGMTEMSPIGSVGVLSAAQNALPFDERIDLKSKQGRRPYMVEFKIVDEDGNRQPHDGEAVGELYVRGNTVVSGYYKNPEATEAAVDADGWFGTGDVAKVGPDGFLTITDRAKDLIKSGGEWISSIDVENMAMAHDDVANCAVIAIPDEKWDERPLLVVVAATETPDKQAILDHLSGSLAKWQVPDEVIVVPDLPMTATGKVSKLTLRQRYAAGELG